MTPFQTLCGMRADPHPDVQQVEDGKMRLTIPGNTDSVRQALQGLGDSSMFSALSPDGLQSAQIVLAEVMNNIVEHAFADQIGTITMVASLHQVAEGAILQCQISDTGLPMPDLTLPEGRRPRLGRIETLPEGGFGWFLIRSLTKDLRYCRINGVNHLTFLLNDEQSK